MSDEGLPEIAWEDPAPHMTFPWGAVAEALRANPGKWALVRRCKVLNTAHSLAHYLKNQAAGWTRGEFEITTRRTAIYARYVGPGR